MAAAAERPYTVKPLFAEPYFVMNIKDAITPKQVKFIQALPMNSNQMNHITDELSLFDRLDTFVNGVFDLTAVVFYLSVAAFFLFLTVQSLEKRRYN